MVVPSYLGEGIATRDRTDVLIVQLELLRDRMKKQTIQTVTRLAFEANPDGCFCAVLFGVFWSKVG